MVVEFVQPTEQMVQEIAANIRECDAVEVMASHGHNPLDAITIGWNQSDLSAVVTVDDVPVCIFGVVAKDFLSGRGTPWLLASTELMKHKRQILVYGPLIVEEMLSSYSRLSNHVHNANKSSIRMLKWLGFTVEDPTPIGLNGEMFHEFHLERIV